MSPVDGGREPDTLPFDAWQPASSGRRRFRLRFQLLALFGLLLAVLLALLLLDAGSQRSTRSALADLRDHSLEGVRQAMVVSDAYAIDVVGAVAKLRGGAIDWAQAQAQVEGALGRVEQSWRYLLAVQRSPSQQPLFSEIARQRVVADKAVDRFRDILQEQDGIALERFANHELYPAVDPLIGGVQRLVDLELERADALVGQEVARADRIGMLRIGISLVALLAALLVGRGILRNLYQGVEGLVRLADDTRRRRFHEAIGPRPRGELGEVVDAFVEMRRDVHRHEVELRAMLDTNERTRRALQERDLFQRSLLSAARIAIVALDAKGRFTHINPFAEKLLGYPAAALIGKASGGSGAEGEETAPYLLDADQMAALAADVQTRLGVVVPPDWRALAAMAEAGWRPREFTMLRSDGRPVPVLLAVSAMRDTRGELLGVLSVATDLTAHKALEQELRESERQAHAANRAKSAFLAAMSHEIRTPMIGVTGMLEVLGHSQLDAEQRRAVDVIQHSADSLRQTIGDILDFSKIEAGRLDLDVVPVSLRKLVASTAYNFMDAASAKGLRLTLEVDAALAPAHVADPVRLRQILSNFVSNALKFTDQGSIRVGLKRVGLDGACERVAFSVTDTGIGLSDAARARLFQPFVQGEADTTRRFGGTGLGLVICRRLAELMQGEVDMDSREGGGTTVRLTVPLRAARTEDIPAQDDVDLRVLPTRLAPDIEQAERERSLILLVDDHPTNRQVLTRQLALAGFTCETAEDGEQGLAKWRSGRYALVLSDVHMPVLDGYAMTRALRIEEAEQGRPRTPVIAITAAALKGEAERGFNAGMDDFLTKPVSIGRLRERLAHWLPHVRIDADAGSEMADEQPVPMTPLRLSALAELAGTDPAQQRALLMEFLATTAQDIDQIDLARTGVDPIRLAREAHRIKGAARLVGAQALSDAAALLESAARSGDLGACDAAMTDVMEAFIALRAWLDAQALPADA